MNRHVKDLQAKSKHCKVAQVLCTANVYRVQSPTGETYTVAVEAEHNVTTCTCRWRTYHPGSLCSHALAALEHAHRCRLSGWTTLEQARRQKKRILYTPDGLFLTATQRKNNG